MKYLALLARVLQAPLCFAGIGAAALWAHVIASYVSASGLPLVSYALFVCTLGMLLSAVLLITPHADKRLARRLPGLVDLVISAVMAVLCLTVGISLAAQGTCSAYVQQQQQQLDAAALAGAQSQLNSLTGSSSSTAAILPQSELSSGVTVQLLPDGEVVFVNSSDSEAIPAPPPALASPAPLSSTAAPTNSPATLPVSKAAIPTAEYWQPAAAKSSNSLGLGVTVTATPAGQPIIAAPGLPEVALPPATQPVDQTANSTSGGGLDQLAILLDYLDSIGASQSGPASSSSTGAAPPPAPSVVAPVGRKLLSHVMTIKASSPRTFTASLTEAMCAAWDLLMAVSFICSALFAVSAVFAVCDMRHGKGMRLWHPSTVTDPLGAVDNSGTELAAAVAAVAVGYPVLQPEGDFAVGYPIDVEGVHAIDIHTATVLVGQTTSAHAAIAGDQQSGTACLIDQAEAETV